MADIQNLMGGYGAVAQAFIPGVAESL